jgi:hypothetical protein
MYETILNVFIASTLMYCVFILIPTELEHLPHH